MKVRNLCFVLAAGGFVSFQASNAFAAGACGSILVLAKVVALPDTNLPPHEQQLAKTWDVPTGDDNNFNGNPAGWIMTQGYPSNGGARSWEKLGTSCTITSQVNAPPTYQVKISALSDLKSGVGTHVGASADLGTTWFTSVTLSNAPRGWSLTIKGTIASKNANPFCSVAINDGTPTILPPNSPLNTTLKGLFGSAKVSMYCSQGHITAFPSGSIENSQIISVITDVSLNWARL